MNKSEHEVAIVGIGCRLPGGINQPDQLVQFLRAHGDAVQPVPADRWDVDLYYHPDPDVPGKAYVKHAAFLQQDIYQFDPEPFGISPREADRLDPQQRLLLECTWDALEDAGIALERFRGSDAAVFIGGFTQDQQNLAFSPDNRLLIDSHTSVGASMTVLSNRISYTFDLHGPSLSVDTACSSSLVATHLGFEAITSGRATTALIGGVNVMLSPMTTIAMCKGHFLAPDGRSKTFDAAADGYGRGEGAGVVVLKRLADAIRDGDRIYAVVRATGVNQDGRTDGMPMPNEEAQRRLCREVLARAGLAPRDIGYVEAHGTGTRAGDPLEARALGSVYGLDRESPLLVGSVKTNLGHMEAAAGVAGLIKAALSVYHREIFPIRGLGTPNPDIPFDTLNLEVALQSRGWPASGTAHAAINSFGYGGTNAHAILSEWRPSAASGEDSARDTLAEPDGSRLQLVPISAASREALSARASDLLTVVNDTDWLAQAATLARRRTHSTERAVILSRSAAELSTQLQNLASGAADPNLIVGRASSERQLLWVFTGMGPQWWGMGRELHRNEPCFRAAVEEVDELFREFSGWSILEEMLRDEAVSKVRSNAIAQPANFVLQVGLVRLLQERGVPADGVLGHSVGEVAAALAANCLSLRDAVYLAYHRSRIQQQVAGRGTMLAVGLPASEVADLLRNSDVAIAAYNSPRSVTLAGGRAELERIGKELTERGAFNRLVPVEVAYHSAQMAPLEGEFLSCLSHVDPQAPQLPLYSTLLGARVNDKLHDAQYWWENARKPVLLQQALEAALRDGYSAFLEVGPHPVLGASIREVLSGRGGEARTSFCLKRGEPERSTLARALATLHVGGVRIDWSRHYAKAPAAQLPPYPFQRRRHWVESTAGAEARLGRSSQAPLASARDRGPTPRFVFDVGQPSFDYLHDHRIQGVPVFPAAGYVELALNTAREMAAQPVACVELRDLKFERAFAVRVDKGSTVIVDADDDGSLRFYGRQADEPWQRLGRARQRVEVAPAAGRVLDVEALRSTLGLEKDLDQLYRAFDAVGLQYGTRFRRLTRLWVTAGPSASPVMLAQLDAAPVMHAAQCLHPTLLDSAFHALLALAPSLSAALLPISVERLTWHVQGRAPAWAHGQASIEPDGSLRADLALADDAGVVLLELQGLLCRPLERRGSGGEVARDRRHLEVWPALASYRARPVSAQTWGLVGDAEAFLGWLATELGALGVRSRRGAVSDAASFEDCTTVVCAFTPRAPESAGVEVCEQLLQLTRGLAGSSQSLRLITFGAQPVGRDQPVRPDQAALAGFARVIMTEHPELDCRVVDLDPEQLPDIAVLASLLDDAETEEEVAVHEHQLLVRRLIRDASGDSLPRESQLPAVNGSELAAALLCRPESREPGPGELALRVQAVALRPQELARLAQQSLSDLRNGSSGTARSVLGTVESVGAAVMDVEPGDRVFVRCPAPLGERVVTPATHAVVLPAALQLEQAAGYFDFMAAWRALHDLARLQAGERILVECDDPALERACIQVAELLRAEVVTDSSQVHVVVSASAEVDRLLESMTRLGDGGRFVHLAPASLPDDARIELGAFRRGVSIIAAGLPELMRARPESYQALGRRVSEAFERQQLWPPRVRRLMPDAPLAEFVSSSAASDLVLEVRSQTAAGPGADAQLFRQDRTYLVSGGLSGFGLSTARWLASQGARSIVLGSRRAEPPHEARAVLTELRARGAEVHCVQLDVTDLESIDRVLAFVHDRLNPLAGVFHSAMVLEDVPLSALTPESLRKVMLPKAYGAWLLHQQTLGLNLEQFVVYSSVSALVGNPGQASYAAANAYLDGLIALRRALGLPGLSVSWGALADVGVVARNAGTEAHLRGLGIAGIPAEQALVDLEAALRRAESHVGIIDMDWDKWTNSFPQTRWNRLCDLVGQSEQGVVAQLRAELDGLPVEAQRSLVLQRIRAGVGEVFHLDGQRFEPDMALKNYGLDSLLAVEVQVAIEKAVGVTIPTMELLAGASLSDVVARVLASVTAEPARATAPVRGSRAANPPPDLRSGFLAKICVQPPYFDLSEFELQGEWVCATASPLAPGEYEVDLVSCAEAARHMAIVGSCAVSQRAPYAGKVYYPVARAEYVDFGGRPLGASLNGVLGALELVRVRARCLAFDANSSRAEAETELLALDGTPLLRLKVTYHVIPEPQFIKLFGEHATPTDERAGHDPYASWQPLPPVEHAGEQSRVELGVVDRAQCLGHFVGYPALPVSVMTRYAIELVAQSAGQRQQRADLGITVLEGRAETESFVFAGAAASLTCSWLGERGGHELWRCEVHSAGRRAAWFEFRVLVREPRPSGFQLRAAQPVAELPGERKAGSR